MVPAGTLSVSPLPTVLDSAGDSGVPFSCSISEKAQKITETEQEVAMTEKLVHWTPVVSSLMKKNNDIKKVEPS